AIVKGAEQLDQRRLRIEVAAVRAEMHTGDRDLLEPRGGDARDFVLNGSDRDAAGRASRRRDDAVGARLCTAGLDAKSEGGAPGDARFDGRAAAAVTIAESLRGRELTLRQAQGERVWLPLILSSSKDERGDRFLLIVRHDAQDVR